MFMGKGREEIPVELRCSGCVTQHRKTGGKKMRKTILHSNHGNVGETKSMLLFNGQ